MSFDRQAALQEALVENHTKLLLKDKHKKTMKAKKQLNLPLGPKNDQNPDEREGSGTISHESD